MYDETPWTNPGMNYADIINQYILCKFLVEGKQNKNTKSVTHQPLGRKRSRADIDWQIFTNTQISLIRKLRCWASGCMRIPYRNSNLGGSK